jgi:phage tail-like protein
MAFRHDPWGAHYFGLEIDGREIAHFMECSGLKSSSQVFEIEEGGLNHRTHKRPGQSRWENIVLKVATNLSMDLLEWRDEFLQDAFAGRRSGSIVIYNLDGQELRRFTFKSAWPVSWEGPSLNSGGSELSMETLEIAHEGLDVSGVSDDRPPETPPEEIPEKLDLPPIHFETDSDVITPEGLEVIAQASADMDRMQIDEIWLEGHTSTSASFDYNQGLAQRRADAVRRELAKHNPDRKVYTQSYGWKYPVASNNTPAGMAANRRTDFYTSSYQSRGRDATPVPDKDKSNPPWNHRDGVHERSVRTA